MKKNIVFIIDDIYNSGGMARVTIFIVNSLIDTEKYNISIVSLSKPLERSFYSISDKCEVINLPLKTFSIRKDSLKAAHELHKIFPKTFEGTFVIDDVGHSIPAWIGLKHCKKAKFISWSHTNFFNGSQYGFSGIGKRLAVKKFDYLIALTKEDQNYYKTILNAKNVVQIYNPKDTGISRQEYNSTIHKIMSCGRLDPVKGFDTLIDVAKIVFQNVKDWQWDIYGEGSEREKLQNKIDEYGLQGKVNLKGYHGDIFNIYKEYSFYVFTSRGEGCPMAMIEAQTAGLPMVSFDFKCGPHDLISDGKNGYIIPSGNIKEMADRILTLIHDEDLRTQFAKNASMNLGELELPYVLNKWESIL